MAAVPNEIPDANARALLVASGLAKHFGPVVALRSADLRVRPGEIHALMGANGAGKSTLVKILTGALTADAGTITCGGRTRTFRSTSEARKAGLICVYQDPSLLPDLTVLQNLKLTATPISNFRRYLVELGMARFDLQSMPRELARPTLSLLDLARALAIEPQLLLLDEITASLPADLTVRVFNVARQLRAEGRSVIFISHRLAEVSALCDRATVLRDGKTVGVVEPAQGGEERIVKLMLGPVADEVAAEAASPSAPATGAVAVEVRDLKAGTLDGVTFTLRFGEVLGVAALEGQGQEELFNCLRSEEHTSELQSPDHLVCRLLLEKKNSMKIKLEVKYKIRNHSFAWMYLRLLFINSFVTPERIGICVKFNFVETGSMDAGTSLTMM